MSANVNVKPQGSPTNEYLGAGAIFHGGDADPENWGTTAPTLIGLTKGGSSFSDNAEFREREADSDYFPMKGARDLTKMTPQLTINALKITTDNLEKFYAGMDTTTGTTYDEVIRGLDLSGSYTNYIWFVGQNRAGKDIAIRLDNVLGDAPCSFTTTKDGEIVLNVVLTAHGDPDTLVIGTPSTYPFRIWLEKVA